MSKKRIIILATGILSILLISSIVFFYASKSIAPRDRQPDNIASSTSEKELEASLAEFSSLHPGLTGSQISFYKKVALDKTIVACENRSDAVDCISAVAYVKKSVNICGEVESGDAYIDCSNQILNKEGNAKLSRCDGMQEDMRIICIANVFQAAKKSEDCSGLANGDHALLCKSIVEYDIASKNHDQSICNKIDDGFIKDYCIKHTIK